MAFINLFYEIIFKFKPNHKAIFLFIFFIALSPVMAEDFSLDKNLIGDLGEYEKANTNISNPNLLENGDFENETKIVSFPKGFTIDHGGGRNNRKALKYVRKDPKLYKTYQIPLELENGKLYEFGVWVKSLSYSNKAFTVKAAIEYTSNGKFAGGEYIHGSAGSNWTLISGKAYIKEEVDGARLTLYVHKGVAGEALFDDAYVRMSSPKWYVNTIWPRNEITRDKEVNFLIKSNYRGMDIKNSNLACYFKIQFIGKKIYDNFFKVADDNIRGNVVLTRPGIYDVNLTLLNVANKKIMATQKLQWTFLQPSLKPPSNACVIDKKGRAIVDGEKFLPIGLYLQDVNESDISRISASSFNCIMPYKGRYLKPANSKNISQITGIKQVLDNCDKNGLKVIFPLQTIYSPEKKMEPAVDKFADKKVSMYVNSLKKHPAILAWYISDEDPLEMIDRLYARRKLINRLDPWHPSWAVFYQYGSFPSYANTADILGIDPYPIRKNTNNISLIDRAMKAAVQSLSTDQMGNNMALWMVPQAHNLSLYDKTIKSRREYLKKGHDPSLEQMRAMVLKMVQNGSKGFIFYSYFDLYRNEFARVDAEKRWSDLCEVAKLLEELESFILSDYHLEEIKLENADPGIEAVKLKNNSEKEIVVITSLGPGKRKAVIPSQFSNLTSRFGTSKVEENGSYVFSGLDISSDILW